MKFKHRSDVKLKVYWSGQQQTQRNCKNNIASIQNTKIIL
jgi:hypothetical protein